MALTRTQTYLLAKYVLISFTVLTIIATFVAYGVVINYINNNKVLDPDNRSYWNSWRAVIITYLVIEDVVALVGLFGAVKENYKLTFAYGIIMSILWIFNFFNVALRNTNIFNYLVALVVIASAFYFARRIRENQNPIHFGSPHVVVQNPAPAFIQVTPSYIPNQSSYAYPSQPNTASGVQPAGSSPPPPYSIPTQPQLSFKY